MFYMMLKLQRIIFLNSNSISLDMSNKTRQRWMLWTLSINVPDYGLEIIVRRFYLCNSEKANAVILGKKEWPFTLMFSCYSQLLVVINNNFQFIFYLFKVSLVISNIWSEAYNPKLETFWTSRRINLCQITAYILPAIGSHPSLTI